jgi:phage/plasmid-associated DNA primase
VFENPVPKKEQDKKLCETILRDEIEGVLAWMVEGEKMRQRDGLGEAPQQFREAKERHHDKMDTIKQFIAECCDRAARGKGRSVQGIRRVARPAARYQSQAFHPRDG